MDCSLSTWPSITQFDDFSWMGLGDIDPLENLDHQDPESSFMYSKESNPSVPSGTLPCSSACNETAPFYTLSPTESFAAGRWENINAEDLASVLDCNFPSNGDSSTTEVDGYDLYSDGILIRPETQFVGDVDAFMADPTSEEANTTSENLAVNGRIMCSLSTSQEDKCKLSNGDTSASMNSAEKDLHHPVLIGRHCMDRQVEVSEMLNIRSAHHINSVKPCNGFQFTPTQLLGCGDCCTFELKDGVHHQQSERIPSSPAVQWPEMQSGSVFGCEKMVHHSSLHCGDVYPSTLDQQVKLADAARVTSDLKRNRAQASRARRLASQRRAKKYPLQKLIRMSSSPSSKRDKLEHYNLATSMPMLQSHVQMVPQNQFPGQGQSFPRSVSNPQMPSCSPVVVQGPHLATCNEVVSESMSVQGIPYYCYQQAPCMAIGEVKHLSSGSNAVQSMHIEQDVQSLTSEPMLAVNNTANVAKSLDVALLEQLQSVLNKVNVQTRLCIRDALYRLARSAKQRQSRPDNITGANLSSSQSDAMETHTNSIDRWIVNILFCKQLTPGEANSETYSGPSSQATPRSIDTSTMSSMSQQWNSCGSCMNLQDTPLHVVTGL